MKQRTKILSVFMAILLVFGTVLSPLSMSVKAQGGTNDSEYRIALDIQQMTQCSVNTFPFGYSNYNCMTNNPQMIASAGYTNVVTYRVDDDGYIRVDDLKVWIGGDYTSVEREVEFAVVDDAGVILSNQGDVVTINSDNYMKDGLCVEAVEVKQGDNLHFVFHGNVGYANQSRCNAKIMYSADGANWSQKNSTGLLWASTNKNDDATQGVENFYYNYSTIYKKEVIAEDSVGILYKDMHDGRSERADFPFMYVKNTCMTNDIQIIASKGYTNVIAYQMPSDGQIKVESLKVWLLNTASDRTVEFAVVDRTGKVLSNDGKIALINNENSTKSGMAVDAMELRQGERLYFVFHSTEGSVNPIRCSAQIMTSTDGATWTQATQKIYNGESLLWPANTSLTEAVQGKDGFYYGYSETYVTHEYTAPSTQEPVQPTTPGTATVPEPNKDGYMPTYKINMEVADMTASTAHSLFPHAMPDKAWDCMTNPLGNQIVSAGYANVLTYQVQEAGTISLKNMKAGISSDTAVVLFAVTDKEGNIIYPSDQTFAVFDKDNKSVEGTFLQDYEVSVGDELRFIFEGVEGKTTACWVRGIMLQYDSEGKETRLTCEQGGYIAPLSGSSEQGADGFHYQYAKTFENVQTGYVTPPPKEVIPGTATVPQPNEDGYMPTYKINMEVADMTASTAHSLFPHAMPDKAWDCMTNPSGNQIVSAGYANVLTYQVQEAGTISLKNMKAGISSDTAVVLFAVTDKEGNIIYPSDQTFAVFDKDNKSVEGTFLQDYEVSVGDELRFIFEGVEGKTTACWVRGIMLQYDSEGKETRLTREDGGYIAPISGSSQQGADGFHYQYAKTFENIQTGYVTPPPPEVIPGTATVPVVNAEGLLPTYKINFEAENMVASTVHKNFPLSMPDKEYDCMSNPKGNKVVSPGYANITTYVAQETGTISLKNMTASTHVATTPDNVVLFAITDKEGNILYPADGTFVVLNKDNPKVTGTFLKDYKVNKGDEINFIFEGVVGKTASCWISGMLLHYDAKGNETRLTREDGLIAPISGSTEQGADGFYYRYAKTFDNVQIGYAVPPAPEVLPGYPNIPVANAQGLVPQYKINFEAENMVESTVHKNFPLSMPDKEYDCMTNPSGNQIVSKGYANIITYTAQKAGKLTLKNMTAAITVKNAPENVVLFAITDKEGKILYPSDGTMVVLDKDNESVTGTFLSQFEVKKGDELNFIFQGVEGKTVACRVRGIMLYIDSEGKETRLTREDGGYIAPISKNTAQGADGFSYRYAKKFENVIIGYVAPKSKAVQWGEGIQVVVSNNPDDFVYYVTNSHGEVKDEVDMIEIIRPGVALRYKFIPWIIVAVSGVIFGTWWIVFFIKNRKGAKQNEDKN